MPKKSEGEGEAVHQASAGNPKKATESKNRRKLDPPKRNRKEGHLSIDQNPVKINLYQLQ